MNDEVATVATDRLIAIAHAVASVYSTMQATHHITENDQELPLGVVILTRRRLESEFDMWASLWCQYRGLSGVTERYRINEDARSFLTANLEAHLAWEAEMERRYPKQ